MEKMGELLARLVSDLPSMGGWPEWAVECILHRGSCKAMFYDNDGRFNGYPSFPNIRFKEEALVERVVHKEMYEAAVSSSKPEWDGEGLPPVGLEIEYMFTKVNYRTDFSRGKVLAYGMHNVFMEHWSSKNEFIQPLDKIEFRPIRSEADKKRAECVIALSRIDPQAMPFEYGDKLSDGSLIGPFWYELYDAIAAGKIPHIRID